MTDPYRPRAYYGARKNGTQSIKLDLDDMREIVLSAYQYFETAGYLVDAFGFECVDSGYEPGYVGGNIDVFVKLTLLRKDLWPVKDFYSFYSEDDVFSMIEFLYDHVSKPQSKSYHDWNNCGYHYSDFSKHEGREEFRARLTLPLQRYGDGWELNEAGEILSMPPDGIAPLLNAKLPSKDATVIEKVASATARYRRHASTIEEREIAVRELAGVLEWIKPQINEALLNKDSTDLYNIANNFGIRHMNQNQKLQYDKPVWLSWMFYHYLNTINACLHIVERQKAKAK